MMRPLSLLCLLPVLAFAKDYPAADLAAFDLAVKAAQPGDVIVLGEGEWQDAVLRIKADGTPAAPITVKAAVPGRTKLTGKSAVRIGGSYVVVDGLWIQNPDTSVGDAIEFRLDAKNAPVHHSRLTNTAVTFAVPLGTAPEVKESRWLGIYGHENRVDHCLFQGKRNKGATSVVWLGEGNEGRHQVDHNYFGPREKLGKNGGETIRVGDSNTSMQTAACVVERNLFERCDGEVECISNKSCGNVYRGNTFLAVSGTLSLRHGNGCLVERNVFLGNNAKGTGGIRIIGEDHIVRGNYLEKLTGDDARCGITFMLGIPDSALNRYFQVRRARVEENTLVDCMHSILIGLSDDKGATLPPVETIISGNKISAAKFTAIEARCGVTGITWKDNEIASQSLGIPPTAGIKSKTPKIVPLKPLARSEVGPLWWQ